jgi:microcystin-dependent protein
MADKRRNLGIPSGVVFPFAGNAAPYGYLICDGRAVSRTEYASLFLMIGTSHGIGDGSSTFNLPDYRGRFLRGVDGEAGLDLDKNLRSPTNGGNSGNSVGSIQEDQFKSHTHSVETRVDTHGVDPGGSYWRGVQTTQSGGTGGVETRPKNINVNYIIKV